MVVGIVGVVVVVVGTGVVVSVVVLVVVTGVVEVVKNGGVVVCLLVVVKNGGVVVGKDGVGVPVVTVVVGGRVVSMKIFCLSITSTVVGPP